MSNFCNLFGEYVDQRQKRRIGCWMMRTALIIVIIVSSQRNGGEACVFKQSPEVQKAQNMWDVKNFKRTVSNCECGKTDVSKADWNVNIKTKSKDKSVKICTGTIVASDLIVTSHKCLEISGQRMRLYDILHFTNGEKHIAGQDEIKVTSPKDSSKSFPVLKIFYNPQYAMSSEKRIYPENDVIIIKVEADFITEQDFNPICLPFYDSKLDDEDIFDQFGTYYGPPTNASGGIVLINGEISKTKQSCAGTELHKNKKMFKKSRSVNTTLCLRHHDLADDTPKMEGGPLIVTKESSLSSFLVGIANDVKGQATSESIGGLVGSMGQKYTFFSDINPVVKFIEFYAHKEKSRWCKTPPGKVLKTRKAKGARSETVSKREKPWPWDRTNDGFIRDESLNCICGLQNTKIGGRIVGGVEAIPREFGWMTVIHVFPNGRNRGGSLCGGSIINDRMILTAAHCVISTEKLDADTHMDPSIAPIDMTVTLNTHLLRNDPEGIEKEVLAVLFHPDYLDGRLARPPYYDSDVALLVLKERLEFAAEKNQGLRPICLPKAAEYLKIIHKNAWVLGWGLTDPDLHSTADQLQKLEIPIQENKFCADVSPSRVTDNNICAGTLNKYRDAAPGDSGGPLQIEDKGTNQWYEVGTVSWEDSSIRNGQTFTAALYADVQKLMPFIDYHAQRVRSKWCKPKK